MQPLQHIHNYIVTIYNRSKVVEDTVARYPYLQNEIHTFIAKIFTGLLVVGNENIRSLQIFRLRLWIKIKFIHI